MIGLTSKQSRVYEAIKHLRETRAVPPNRLDVSRYLNGRGSDIDRVIKPLKRKRFIYENGFGDLIAVRPPHESIVEDVLSRSSVDYADVIGPRRFAEFVVVRRVIARRLRKECGYSFHAIATVLNRNVRSVDEYFKPEFCARRAERRKLKHRAKRAAQSEMRMAA
jgi:hypothetical protein